MNALCDTCYIRQVDSVPGCVKDTCIILVNDTMLLRLSLKKHIRYN